MSSTGSLYRPAAFARDVEVEVDGNGRPGPTNPLLRPLSLGDWLVIAGFFSVLVGYMGGIWFCVQSVMRWLFGG